MNDDSANDPIDLSPLDSVRDDVRFAAITASVARDAMVARARRAAEPRDLLTELAAWSRPALAAAAIILGVSLPTLGRAVVGPAAPPPAVSATDIMGIPRELMQLVRSPRTPSLSQIDAALASVAGR